MNMYEKPRFLTTLVLPKDEANDPFVCVEIGSLAGVRSTFFVNGDDPHAIEGLKAALAAGQEAIFNLERMMEDRRIKEVMAGINAEVANEAI